MVTETKKAKRARWKKGLRLKQGLVIVTIQLYHEGDKNKNLKRSQNISISKLSKITKSGPLLKG